MKVASAGRAAEQVVFGRVTNGAANDLESVTELARAMVFEYGMSEVSSRTMRADNYALSEETKRLRDGEQARLTDDAFDEAVRLLRSTAPRSTASRRRCSRRRRWTRTSSERCSQDVGADSALARPSAPCASRRADARTALPSYASRAWSRGESIILAWPSTISTRRSTYERLFGAELEHRETVPTRASRPRRCASGTAGSSCSRSLGDETPVGKFLANRGPGMHHVAYEVEDVGAALGSSPQRRRADRRAAPARDLRARGRVRPPARRPRRPHGDRQRG